MDKKKVIEIAESQIGYTEKGNNWNKYAKFFDEEYPNFYNGRKQNCSWCDVFVDWIFVQAYGFDTGRKLLCQPLKSCGAGVTFSYDYYKAKKQTGSTPKVGAQIFFRANKDSKKPNHTGLIVAVEKTDKYYKITTIEGNKSNSVKKCTYTTDTKIFGFGYPDYDMDKTQATPVASKPKEDPKPVTPSKPTVATKTYVVVCPKGLNIRKSYSDSSPKIGALNYGAKIQVTKEEKGWVKLANRDGWCCIGSKGVKYLKLKK
jgi:hypothetical protein